MESVTSPIGSASCLRHMRCGFAYTSPYALTPGQPTPGLTYPPPSLLRFPPQSWSVRSEDQPLSTSILEWARLWRYRNINLLCIDYASRPRLSSRLTLGGLAFPRNPWAYGGGVSHPSLATHTSILTRLRSTSVHTAASLQSRRSPTAPAKAGTHSFGSELEPRYIIRAGPLDQ